MLSRMTSIKSISKAAAALGRVSSPAKTSAARTNGQLGGRPVTYSGQEPWTCGYELRWVLGTDDSGPAKVMRDADKVCFRGTYAEAVRWLEARACRPVRRTLRAVFGRGHV
jgi:hypothetical protein